MNFSVIFSILLVAMFCPAQLTFAQHAKGIPTMYPYYPFDPDDDLQRLMEYTSISKSPEDEQRIWTIVSKYNFEQLQTLDSTYKKKYESTLTQDVLSLIPWKSGEIFTQLFLTSAEVYAHYICNSLRPVEVDKYTLMDILCCIDDVKMEDIIEAYHENCDVGTNLVSDIKLRFTGEFADLLGAILEGKRRPPIDELGGHIASTSEIGVVGTDDCMWIQTIWEPIIKIFTQYSYEELVEFSLQQEVIAGLSLEQSIRNEAVGLYYFRTLLIKILHYAESPSTHYAQLLKDSIIRYDMANETFPTADQVDTLTWVIVTRSELDLQTIAEQYKRLFHKSLEDDVKAKVSSNYKTLFVNLIHGNKKI